MFRFKLFNINQDRSAMKVGTDGVLLGAWARAFGEQILDIGSGTGLIALMMAQRCPTSKIMALDKDENAYMQTKENIQNSPFKTQITALQQDIVNYNPVKLFDHLICNPPFYLNSKLNPSPTKSIARHQTSNELAKWIHKSFEISSDKGIFSFIFPCEFWNTIENFCLTEGWFLHRLSEVKPTPEKAPHRYLCEWRKQASDVLEKNVIIIENSRHNYHQSFVDLCKDFYLKM